MFLIFMLLSSILWLSTAHGQTVPMALREGSGRFLARSLGSACYSVDSVRQGLPCNPAVVAKDKKPRFESDLFLGSNLDYINQAQEILNNRSDEVTVSSFFSRRESVEGELSIEASIQAPTWGIALEPYRLIAVTRFENPSLPMIDLVIAEEQNIKVQLASYLGENFYAGLQARYGHVRYIGQYFALSEAFASGKEKLFAVDHQDLLYLEPGFLYAWEDISWQPQISGMLAQWGITNEKTDEYPIQPEGLLGASIKPITPVGLLELGVQLRVNNETETFRDSYRFACAYQLWIYQTVFAISEHDYSVGIISRFKAFSSGISYWNQTEGQSIFLNLAVSL